MGNDKDLDATAGTLQGVPMWQQEKLGGTCCGCCCDYRRAVIILSVLYIVLAIIGLISSINRSVTTGITDDTVTSEVEDIYNNNRTKFIALTAVDLIVTVVGLVGAILYIWPCVALNIVYAVINFILVIVFGVQQTNDILEAYKDGPLVDDDVVDYVDRAVNIASGVYFGIVGVITLLWIYPSIFLVLELKKKTMTQETYPREEKSCCCVANRV